MQVGKLYRPKTTMHFGVASDGMSLVKVSSGGVLRGDACVLLYLGCEYSRQHEDYTHIWLGPDGRVLVRYYTEKDFANKQFELCK